jgi:uncharacterized protein (TIGR03435 family)
MRIAVLTGAFLIAVSIVTGQAAELRFEAASVRPATKMADASQNSWGTDTGRVVLPFVTLGYVIQQAFGLRADQIKGAKWLDERYEILATAPAGLTRQQINQMMQALLIERFQMKIHREIRDSPVYALTLRKGATPPQEAISDPNGDKSESAKFDRAKETITGGVNGPYGHIRLTATAAGLRSEFEAVSMEGLASYLSQGMAGLPVSDKTGLNGSYRIVLDVAMADLPGMPAAPAKSDSIVPAEPSGYSVIESLRTNGLDLVRERAPVEFFVIDSMERTPTPN